MKRTILSLSSALMLLGISTHSQAQTATVTYNLNHAVAVPVPVLSTGILLLLGILLCAMGAAWLHKNPNSSIGKLAVSAIGLGLLTSTISGGWLVGNAHAVITATSYLMSENPSPVVITSFPAVLENDFEASASVSNIDVTECPHGSNTSGTCGVGTVLLGGESCTLDAVCESTLGVTIAVEGVSGDILVDTACASGEYSCQAQTVCESITNEACVYQTYDCYTGSQGSWYPTSGAGSSSFNFAITYDFGGGGTSGGYGNICACDSSKMVQYGLAQNHTDCGLGHWTRQ